VHVVALYAGHFEARPLCTPTLLDVAPRENQKHDCRNAKEHYAFALCNANAREALAERLGLLRFDAYDPRLLFDFPDRLKE
jgi:hypothetical protein